MERHRFKDGSYQLRVLPGEEVISVLTAFVNDMKICAGSFTAIGAAHDVELGYWDGKRKIYLRKKLRGTLEIVALTGNVSRIEDGRSFVHAHAVLGDSKFRSYSGHLFAATAEPTCEISLRPQEGAVERVMDKQVGLRLLSL
jgi:predicted DNA-binding protein with PD1-like motif